MIYLWPSLLYCGAGVLDGIEGLENLVQHGQRRSVVPARFCFDQNYVT